MQMKHYQTSESQRLSDSNNAPKREYEQHKNLKQTLTVAQINYITYKQCFIFNIKINIIGVKSLSGT